MPSVVNPRCWQNPKIYIPAQVPIDAKNVANGVGADSIGGWSVFIVNCPKWASTRAPPGKSITISMSSYPPANIYQFHTI
jgi:hypothetical protein